MKILAIETSTEYCSVALWISGQVFMRCERVEQKHSERLMPMLQALLADTLPQPIKLSELDGIAFGKGPGSFTGVRIACGVTQGLALGANLPVVGICTLEALAEASGHDSVIASLDARMGEIYHAAYQKRYGEWHTVTEPCVCKPEDAPPLLGDNWFGVGSGFKEHGNTLITCYAGQMMEMKADLVPKADAIARLGATRLAEGYGVDAALALPLYLRDKVALTTKEREGK